MSNSQSKPLGLNVAVLRALAKHVALVDDIRLWKNGVHICPHDDGLIYSASDGRFAVRWLDKFDDLFADDTKLDKPITLLAKDLQRLDTVGEGDPVIQPSYPMEDWLWRVGGVVCRALDVNYPNIAGVIPRTLERTEGQYNFALFAQCHKVAAEASRRKKSAVTLYVCQNGAQGAALVSSPDCENFMAVIMPFHPQPMFDAAPHWSFHVDPHEQHAPSITSEATTPE